MKNTVEKINETVQNRRIKLHVFRPSNRSIWTVVGDIQEYWVDPDLEFCTCAGYYFSQLKGKQGCYHLDSVKIALMERRIEPVVFTDAEYGDFIASLIAGMMD